MYVLFTLAANLRMCVLVILCMYSCLYVCVCVCMYVRMYVLATFSGRITPIIKRHLSIAQSTFIIIHLSMCTLIALIKKA